MCRQTSNHKKYLIKNILDLSRLVLFVYGSPFSSGNVIEGHLFRFRICKSECKCFPVGLMQRKLECSCKFWGLLNHKNLSTDFDMKEAETDSNYVRRNCNEKAVLEVLYPRKCNFKRIKMFCTTFKSVK